MDANRNESGGEALARRLGLLGLGLLVAGVSVAATQQGPRQSVPRIAQVLGARMGANGQSVLERQLGRGLRSISGHPNSRLSWRTLKPAGYITTDGFSQSSDGWYVLEDLEWRLNDPEDADRSIPLVRRPNVLRGWLGTIVPGMTETQVRRLTAGLPAPTRKNETWTWEASGYATPNPDQPQDAYRHWTAELAFENHHLQSITLSCD